MEDVSIRVHRGRALLDSAGAWQTSQVRDPAKMAEGPLSGQPGDIRSGVEKSPEDVSVGALPFDYSVLGDSGCPPDAGGNEPRPALTSALQSNALQKQATLSVFNVKTNSIEPEIPVYGVEETVSIPHEQETRQEMDKITKQHTSLVKANQVRSLALELMAQRFSFNGKPKFNRVSPQFVNAVERFVHAAIVSAIRRHPSTGKHIKHF